MNHIEPSKNKNLVDSKPLFASTWLALFSVLRKNYNARHDINLECPETKDTPQSDKKLN